MSPHKVWLILRSEFLRRVRSTAFLLATLLVPVGVVALAAAPVLFGYLAQQTDKRAVAIVDDTNQLADSLIATAGDRVAFRATTAPLDSVRAAVREGRYDGYLHLPASLLEGRGRAAYYSTEGGGFALQIQLETRVNRLVRQHRLKDAGVPANLRSIVNADVELTTRRLGATDDATGGSSFFHLALGYVLAFAVYFSVFIYGQFVMQGVIEEKSTRVVEVIVSSVRPFELLMGKVLGIGAMALSQMTAWAVLAMGGFATIGPFLPLLFDPADLGVDGSVAPQSLLDVADVARPALPVDLLAWFFLFFLGGFLLYGALFAAVGSAVEQQQDAQSLLLPVMFPLILPILFLFFIIESPSASLSVGMSMIPFFSPVLMILRAAITPVPFWQIATAFLLLVGTFIGTIWVAGRIYRVGILSYGKTPSLRELARWVTYE